MSDPTGLIPFPSTDWKTVSRAGDDDPEVRRAALGALLGNYLLPLRAYLRASWRFASDRADDLLQDFLADRVLERDLVRWADRERGKFRTFLLTALDRFVLNDLRRGRAAKREIDRAAVPLDGADVPDPSQGGADAFELAWARRVLQLAVEHMRRECAASGRADVWGVFEARVLLPALGRTEPTPMRELLDRFGFNSPEQGFNVLATGKRMLARHLRAEVRRYADDEADVEEEISRLRRALSGPGAQSAP